MKKTFILLPIVGILFYLLLSSYSEGPASFGIEATLARGSSSTQGCNCHTVAATAATIVGIQLYDATGTTLITGGYTGGTTYVIKLTGSQANLALTHFGFELTVVGAANAGTGSATNAGVMSAPPSGTHLTTAGGLSIFEHYNGGSPAAIPGVQVGSTMTYAQQITWTAPVSGSGSVKVYATINAVNHDGSATTTDKWNNTSITITEAVTVAPITGNPVVCQGVTTQLSDITPSGTWSSNNTNIATVTNSGLVTGVSGGTTNISYITGAGFAIQAVTVNPLPTAGSIAGTSSVCVGVATPLTDGSAGGAWTSSNTNIATVNNTGSVTGVAAGTATINYVVSNSCGTATATAVMTVNPQPVAGSITGASSVCAGVTTALTDGAAGGAWTSSNTNIATVNNTGNVTGVGAGSTTIVYSVTNSCGTASVTAAMTVNPQPVAGSITGASSVCAGVTTALTDGAAGGAWTSSNTTIATVNNTGTVTGVAAGSTTIVYSVTNSCGTASVTAAMTVNPQPVAGTISGPSSVCVGVTIALTDGSAGGAWTSSNTTLATVTNTGIVTGLAPGSVNITYTVSNGCGSANANVPITVNAQPVAGSISGPGTVCAGSSISLTDGSGGGVWTSNNTTIATVSNTGTVTGVSGGSVNISYTVSNSCNTVFATAPVTVSPLPLAGSINGPSSVCTGVTIALTDGTGGGAWTSSNTTIATVTSTGTVTGVAAGSVNISYTVSNGCGSQSAIAPVTVNPQPVAGTITGLPIVCVNATIALTDQSSGGAWSSSNTNVATVSSTGIVTGVSGGSATIVYVVVNTCNTALASMPITVNPLPVAGTITGASSVCAGVSTPLTDASLGGVWSSSNTTVATVNNAGLVTGVAAGTATINYIVSNTCGTVTATAVMTVNPQPNAGSITNGSSSVCVGVSTTFSDAAPGGAWSSNNSTVATINTTGTLTGASVGSMTVSYTVTNGCGTARATTPASVTATATAGSISGLSNVCPGAHINLSDGVAGGTWSSDNSAVATVSTSGVVTGGTSGTANISYTVNGSCGAASTGVAITVNTAPAAGTISGTATVCAGSNTQLSDNVASGVWSSSNTALATINAGGLAFGVSGGQPVISYTFTNSCGAATATYTLTVSPLPAVGTITGTPVVCVNAVVNLTDATAGGAWTSSNTGVATVNTNGGVTGAGAGATAISYTFTNGCGNASATYTVTVESPLSAGSIGGLSTVCAGNSLTLSDGVAGGTWTSSNTSIATVTNVGVVQGVSAGSVNISYTVNNSCGAVSTNMAITVNPQPVAGTINGASSVCVGVSIPLTDAAAGGVWSSSNSTFATVTPSGAGAGTVFGSSTGSVNISYTVTNGCGAVTATKTIAVNPQPVAGTITGISGVCAGTNIHLSDAAAGGTWSSTNSAIATVTTTGIVNGVTAGITVISYAVTNTCGTAVTSGSVTVNPQPVAGAITGISSVCVGTTVSLTDAATGGVWSSSNTLLATVTNVGVVSGIAAGGVVISYSVTNSCGTAVATMPVTINPQPVAGSITGLSSVCVGANLSLSDAAPGGAWTSSNTSFATVSAQGVVTGVAAGGVNISYTVTNGCNTAATGVAITVNPLAIAGTISGPSSVCPGNTISLTDATTGGVWSSSNTSLATVSTNGTVTGIAPGNVTIGYAVTNGCGAVSATQAVTVNPLANAGTITGGTSVCENGTLHLSDASVGGSWSSSNTANAAVDAAGNVSGILAGTTDISYVVTTACGTATTSVTITVNPLAVAGTISGLSSVCPGATITLSDDISGGTWSSSNSARATVSTAGVVTGVSAGAVNISYAVTTTCGTAIASYSLTVNGLPSAGTITGSTSSLCAGTTRALSDAVAGGTWSSGNAGIATVNATTGIVSGVAAGTATISYVITGACGSATATRTVTIIASSDPGTISGPTKVCLGSTIQLSDHVSGGVWGATNGNAQISSSGLVLSWTVGLDTILYTVTNSCGSAHASYPIEVQDLSDCTSGVKNPGANGLGIHIYPDPSTGSFTVDLPETGKGATITITDIYGRVVEHRVVADPSVTQALFNLGSVARGTYVVKIVIADRSYTQKIEIR